MYGLGPRQSSHTTGKSVFSQPSSSGSAFWRDACANEGGEGAGRGASGGAREIGGRTDAGRVDGTRRGGGTRQRDARTMRCACGLARRALQIRVGRSRGRGASSRVGSVFAHGRDGTHHGRFASRVFHEPWSRAGGRAMGARRGAGAVLAFLRRRVVPIQHFTQTKCPYKIRSFTNACLPLRRRHLPETRFANFVRRVPCFASGRRAVWRTARDGVGGRGDAG